MRLQENKEPEPGEKRSAGEDFVKRIGLLGAILFLLLSIIATILMFTVNIHPTEPQHPESTTPYASGG